MTNIEQGHALDNEEERIRRHSDLRKKMHEAVEVRQKESAALEGEAVALFKQYGFFLPGPAKAFFRKLAIHLKWQDLLKVTQ